MTIPSRKPASSTNESPRSVFPCAIWGGLSPALKISLEGIPPFGAAAFRFLIGLISLLIWGGFKRIRWWRPAVSHRHLLAFGALFVFQISVFNLGTEQTSSSHSIVFLSTNPIFVALAAHFLIPNDRLNLRRSCGLPAHPNTKTALSLFAQLCAWDLESAWFAAWNQDRRAHFITLHLIRGTGT